MSTINSTILHFVVSEDNQLFTAAFALTVLFATAAVYSSFSSKDGERGFPKLPGIQLYHALNFYNQRYGFVQSNFERNPGQSFSFDLAHHKVIALTGEDSRRAFYSDPGFDLTEGFKLLAGGAPKSRDIPYEETEMSAKDSLNNFKKTLNQVMSKIRMQNGLPTLLEDIIGMTDKWVASGRIDPFIEFFDLASLITARTVTCHGFTTNEADLKTVMDLFWTLRAGPTVTSLILPWFPNPNRRERTNHLKKMNRILRGYVEARRRAEPTSDAIDFLIAEGKTTDAIVKFIVMVIFAGMANTGVHLCWTLLYLDIHQEWREKCKKEIKDFLSRQLGDSFAVTPDKLSAIPLSAWEDEVPTLDACIRETQRLVLTGIAFRRNLREGAILCGKVVNQGDFFTYRASEAHLNPEYYPEPHKYDPGRWLRPDPVPDTPFPFVGWGAGRHPCPGQKIAKLELKWILVPFLTRYEYELVNEDGKLPNPLPVPNNGCPRSRPLGAACYFKVKKVPE